MKLHEWFEQQGEKAPSSFQKMSIYSQFLDKSHRSISYNKVTYYAKVAIFSLGIFFIFTIVFYSFVPPSHTPYKIAKVNDAYMTLDQRTGQFAQADTIGDIIHAKGNIEIIQGTTYIETDILSDNDRVLLAKGAEMRFRVDTDVEATIIGPAEFVLEDRGIVDGIQQYAINLIAGEYLEVVSIEDNNKDADSSAEPIATIIVQAADFTLEQVDTRGDLDLIISVNNEGQRQVENKGSEVVIKKIVADKQTFVAVQANETVSINDDIAFIVDDIDTLLEDTNQLSVTYEVSTNDTDDTVNDILIRSATTRKVVLDEETMGALRTTINTTFLAHDISKMKQYYTAGNQSAFLIAYGNLLARLQRAHILVDMAYIPLAADRATLLNAADYFVALAESLSTRYYIEPSLLDAIHMVARELRQLSEQDFGTIDEDRVREDTIVDTGSVDTDQDNTNVDVAEHDTAGQDSYETLLNDLE